MRVCLKVGETHHSFPQREKIIQPGVAPIPNSYRGYPGTTPVDVDINWTLSHCTVKL